MLTRPEKAPRQLQKPLDRDPPDIVFAWERLSAITREVSPLFHRHWREIALNQDSIPLEPDWDGYLGAELSGMLKVMTARSKGALVGYLFVFVRPHLHYFSTVWAIVDIFWLDPLYRFGWNGVRMLREFETGMRKLDVRVIHIGEKASFRDGGVGVILKRLGYVLIEHVWAKTLGD